MTKSQTVALLAERTGLEKVQIRKVLEEQAKLAYAEAKNGFVIPGLGKLLLKDRAARAGRNPITGETIQIPAKTVIKFRVSKDCKQAVLEAQ